MNNIIAFPIQYIPTEKYIDEEDKNNVLMPTEYVWKCNCSGHLFFLTPDGAKCSNCGIITSEWAE